MGRVNHEPYRYLPPAFQAVLDLEYLERYIINLKKCNSSIFLIQNEFR
jgi:hypothetical protein